MHRVGRSIQWRGKGVEETGVDKKSGKTVVRIDPTYFRPTEVDLLIGDASEARQKLGWKPKTSFAQLVKEMVEGFNRPTAIFGDEPQEQDHGVTIALDRRAAHAAERREVFLEEADEQRIGACCGRTDCRGGSRRASIYRPPLGPTRTMLVASLRKSSAIRASD